MDWNGIFQGIEAGGVVGGAITVWLALKKQGDDSRESREKERKAREAEIAQHVETWTNLTRDMKDINIRIDGVNTRFDATNKEIEGIKRILGNGYFGGLKEEIANMEKQCAREMGELAKQVEMDTPRIKDLEEWRHGFDKK